MREHGDHVAAHRVADHAEAVGLHADVGEHAGVRRLVLLADDVDVDEVVGEAGHLDLALLVHEVALGDDGEPVVAAEILEHGGDVGHQSHRLDEHRHAGLHHLTDHRGRHRRPRDADTAHSTIDSVNALTPYPEIGTWRRSVARSASAQVDAVGDVRTDELDEARLDGEERVLAVPQRVVGVEPDDVEAVHG